ncbi:hypothetical protein ACLB2K_002773 [Fragaria x ananassa]
MRGFAFKHLCFQSKSQSQLIVKTALLAWFEIICGLVIYSLYKLFFSDDDDVLDLETSDSTALFSVADRLSKLYDGAKVYVGLRIPDADTSSPQPIDLVLLNKGEAVVIAVKNLSGFISVKPDGSWVSESLSKHKSDHHPDLGAFRGGKKEMQESIHQQLDFILSTAPMWDSRLNFHLDAMQNYDVQALRHIKRSKISRLVVQKTSMLGFAPSRLQVLYAHRDYRSEGTSTSDWKEASVRSSTEVVFQLDNSSKVRKFKLSSISSMSLSA